MPYTIPTFEEIRNNYLRDVKNINANAATHPDSDTFVRASATASAVDGLYHYQHWISRQVLPDTADPENIEYHAALRGLTKKPATCAEGVVTLSIAGKNVPSFPAGISLTHKESGMSFVTTEGYEEKAVTLANGSIKLLCLATQKCAIKQLTNAEVILQNAPSGVASKASLTTHGGSDEETHDELLSRLLFYMKNPPGGGTKTDYELWALEEPGITYARCLPKRRGPGTVDVLVWGEDGVVSKEVIARSQARIDTKRPVACQDCLVLSPRVSLVDITAKVRLRKGTFTTLHPKATEALEAFFQTLPPGGHLSNAGLLSVLMGLSDVVDAEIIQPAASVYPTEITWLRLGTLTLRSW